MLKHLWIVPPAARQGPAVALIPILTTAPAAVFAVVDARAPHGVERST